jgi:DNA-binding transcriptional ArsR family regulator
MCDMDVPHPIPHDLAIELAQRFRLLSDPTRLRILDLLRDGEHTVQQLAELSGSTQQNVSKHLQQLRDGGVVGVRRDGVRAWHFVTDDAVFALCGIVCDAVQRTMRDEAARVEHLFET